MFAMKKEDRYIQPVVLKSYWLPQRSYLNSVSDEGNIEDPIDDEDPNEW